MTSQLRINAVRDAISTPATLVTTAWVCGEAQVLPSPNSMYTHTHREKHGHKCVWGYANLSWEKDFVKDLSLMPRQSRLPPAQSWSTSVV